jgi:flagellar hook protein FlgE
VLRAMFTAIGGLKNHQVMLDVTANNIANVNTIGYKAQRVAFESMVAQVLRGAAGPTTGGAGGSGPMEVGLGMAINSIGSIMTQGSLQTTGQWSDMGINGDGYFIVAKSVDTTAGGALPATPDLSFTRAGNFTVDEAGWLVDQHGQYVLCNLATSQGPPVTFAAPPVLSGLQIPTNATSVSVDQSGVVSYDLGGRIVAGRIELAKFPNPAGLSRVGQNDLKDTPNSGLFDAADPAGAVIWGDSTTNGLGYVQSGAVEMSNVDLAQEFTNMIVAQRGFQANTRVITTSDEILQELVNMKR